MSDAPPDGRALFARGMATRRKVLGDAHVDRAGAAATDFDAPFQELITEAAWARVWSRPQLSPRERSMVTIALLAALGHWEEVEMHVRATANTGASREDVREALLHVAIYAGVPAANKAFRIAGRVFAELGEDAGPDARKDARKDAGRGAGAGGGEGRSGADAPGRNESGRDDAGRDDAGRDGASRAQGEPT